MGDVKAHGRTPKLHTGISTLKAWVIACMYDCMSAFESPGAPLPVTRRVHYNARARSTTLSPCSRLRALIDILSEPLLPRLLHAYAPRPTEQPHHASHQRILRVLLVALRV